MPAFAPNILRGGKKKDIAHLGQRQPGHPRAARRRIPRYQRSQEDSRRAKTLAVCVTPQIGMEGLCLCLRGPTEGCVEGFVVG